MKKKIAIIHHSSVIGGAGISLYNLLVLLEDTYDIKVYVSDLSSHYSKFLSERGITTVTYSGRIGAIYYHAASGGFWSKAFWVRLFLIPVQFNYWKNVLLKESPDLLIVNSLVLSWFSIFRKPKNMKTLCFVRETFYGNGRDLISGFQRKMLAHFTGVSFISKYDQEVATLPRSVRSFINHNYVTFTGESITRASNREVFKVLYVGGISKEKGIEVIVQAAKYLRKKTDIIFDIIGEDYRHLHKSKQTFFENRNSKLSRKLKAKVNRIGLNKTVNFNGLQRDVTPYFSECDVVVCPITSPHQQRAIFEAGFFKKPVIVSNFDQLNWAVSAGFNGEFFEVNNAKALAQKILKLYDDLDYCTMLGLNNNKRTLANHTKEVCDKKVIAMIKNILDG